MGLLRDLVLAVPLTGVLYGMSFNLSDMERGELCHDRYMDLLLADYVQDVCAAKPNARPQCTGSAHIIAGFW